LIELARAGDGETGYIPWKFSKEVVEGVAKKLMLSTVSPIASDFEITFSNPELVTEMFPKRLGFI
jgi:hypothetical protein